MRYDMSTKIGTWLIHFDGTGSVPIIRYDDEHWAKIKLLLLLNDDNDCNAEDGSILSSAPWGYSRLRDREKDDMRHHVIIPSSGFTRYGLLPSPL